MDSVVQFCSLDADRAQLYLESVKDDLIPLLLTKPLITIKELCMNSINDEPLIVTFLGRLAHHYLLKPCNSDLISLLELLSEYEDFREVALHDRRIIYAIITEFLQYPATFSEKLLCFVPWEVLSNEILLDQLVDTFIRNREGELAMILRNPQIRLNLRHNHGDLIKSRISRSTNDNSTKEILQNYTFLLWTCDSSNIFTVDNIGSLIRISVSLLSTNDSINIALEFFNSLANNPSTKEILCNWCRRGLLDMILSLYGGTDLSLNCNLLKCILYILQGIIKFGYNKALKPASIQILMRSLHSYGMECILSLRILGLLFNGPRENITMSDLEAVKQELKILSKIASKKPFYFGRIKLEFEICLSNLLNPHQDQRVYLDVPNGLFAFMEQLMVLNGSNQKNLNNLEDYLRESKVNFQNLLDQKAIEMNSLIVQNQSLNNQFVELDKKCKSLDEHYTEELSRANVEINTLRQENSNFSNICHELSAKNEVKMEELRQLRIEYQENITELEKKMITTQNAMENDLQSKSIEFERMEIEMNALKGSLDNCLKDLEGKTQENEFLNKSVRDLEEKLQSFSTELRSKLATNQLEKSKLCKQFEEEITTLKRSLIDRQGECEISKVKERSLLQEIDNLKELLNKKELAISQLNIELEGLLINPIRPPQIEDFSNPIFTGMGSDFETF